VSQPRKPATPEVCLDAADAVELAELLGFIGQWLDEDPERSAGWLARFAGGGYPLEALRADLDRFAFLLAAPDSETATRLLDGPADPAGTDPSEAP
jgi:hypothetical protein